MITGSEIQAALIGSELGGDIDLAYKASLAVPNAMWGTERGKNASGISFGVVQLDIGNNAHARSMYTEMLGSARGMLDEATFVRLVSYSGVKRPDLHDEVVGSLRGDLRTLGSGPVK